MRAFEKLFSLLKKILLWITKILYICPIALLIYILLFEDYGRAEVGGVILCSALAFIS
jgi:hypothetical protein